MYVSLNVHAYDFSMHLTVSNLLPSRRLPFPMATLPLHMPLASRQDVPPMPLQMQDHDHGCALHAIPSHEPPPYPTAAKPVYLRHPNNISAATASAVVDSAYASWETSSALHVSSVDTHTRIAMSPYYVHDPMHHGSAYAGTTPPPRRLLDAR